jgi:DNA processing protein
MLEFSARLAAIVTTGSPRVTRALLASGAVARREHLDGLDDPALRQIEELTARLSAERIDVILPEDPVWPDQINALPTPPAYLFVRGNLDLLGQRAIGMCGSRHATDRGLEAARICGQTVAQRDWHVVSGYAQGVDTETHLAALRAGGNTVIVLAEGILHFRRKRVFDRLPFNSRTVLVLSQFPPTQRWTAGAAMTRNGLIVTLGGALVVIEAGETGGTLNAGRSALELRQPVFALEFSDGPRKGNEALIRAGASALRTPGELADALNGIAPSSPLLERSRPEPSSVHASLER